MTVCKNVDHHRNCTIFWKRFIFCSQHNLTSLVKSCFLQNIHLYSDVLYRWKYCSCTGNFLSERQNSSLLESKAGCLSGKLAKLCSIADWAKSREESFCCFFNYFFDLLFRQPLSWKNSKLLTCFWCCQWFDFNANCKQWPSDIPFHQRKQPLSIIADLCFVPLHNKYLDRPSSSHGRMHICIFA